MLPTLTKLGPGTMLRLMALKLAIASGGLIVLGLLLAQLRVLPPLVCFGTSVLGGAAGLAVLPAALVAWKNGTKEWHFLALGVLLWLLPLLLLSSARGKPRINDISSDLAEPPEFVALKQVPANGGRDMSYPEENRSQQRAGYPDLASLRLADSPSAAMARAKQSAEALGWTVVEVADDAGRLEATQESRGFHFVDDVVGRVRSTDAGSQVDVRSKSRDGKGDLGKNAERIQAFMGKMASGS
ncbi:MAG TPA: DUF1499 domain-containing protein [Polyangiaceae bacterium]|nr:DUF1499 domain-containing protein [Polyangiaceae bacterium]